MNFRRFSDTTSIARLSGGDWNDMAAAVTRLLNMSVTAPLTLLNSSAGIRLGFEHPLAIWITGKITGPLLDPSSGDPIRGKFTAMAINGPAAADSTSDLSADDYGTPASTNSGDLGTLEVWNETLDDIPTGTPVSGWAIGCRNDDGGNRLILTTAWSTSFRRVRIFKAHVTAAPTQSDVSVIPGNIYTIELDEEIGYHDPNHDSKKTDLTETSINYAVNLSEPANGLGLLTEGVKVIAHIVVGDSNRDAEVDEVLAAYFYQPVEYHLQIHCAGLIDTPADEPSPDEPSPDDEGGPGGIGGGIYAEVNYHTTVKRLLPDLGYTSAGARLCMGIASSPPPMDACGEGYFYWQMKYGAIAMGFPLSTAVPGAGELGTLPMTLAIFGGEWINMYDPRVANGPCNTPASTSPNQIPICITWDTIKNGTGQYLLVVENGIPSWKKASECCGGGSDLSGMSGSNVSGGSATSGSDVSGGGGSAGGSSGGSTGGSGGGGGGSTGGSAGGSAGGGGGGGGSAGGSSGSGGSSTSGSGGTLYYELQDCDNSGGMLLYVPVGAIDGNGNPVADGGAYLQGFAKCGKISDANKVGPTNAVLPLADLRFPMASCAACASNCSGCTLPSTASANVSASSAAVAGGGSWSLKTNDTSSPDPDHPDGKPGTLTSLKLPKSTLSNCSFVLSSEDGSPFAYAEYTAANGSKGGGPINYIEAQLGYASDGTTRVWALFAGSTGGDRYDFTTGTAGNCDGTDSGGISIAVTK